MRRRRYDRRGEPVRRLCAGPVAFGDRSRGPDRVSLAAGGVFRSVSCVCLSAAGRRGDLYPHPRRAGARLRAPWSCAVNWSRYLAPAGRLTATLVLVLVAFFVALWLWHRYEVDPWTRD